MPVVLIDGNIEGHGRTSARMRTPEWRELTTAVDVTFRTFRDVGLDPAAPDDVVWRLRQAHGYYLLTSNRNEKSATSLETTIRREGTVASLPVFTVPLADRVYDSREFLDKVVDRLLTYMIDPDNIRGTGRIYLP